MNMISAMVVTLNGASTGATLMGTLFLEALVFVIVLQLDQRLQEDGIALPRWCIVTAVIVMMFVFALRMILPGREVVAFSIQ